MNKKAYIKNVIRTTLAEAYEKQASSRGKKKEYSSGEVVTDAALLAGGVGAGGVGANKLSVRELQQNTHKQKGNIGADWRDFTAEKEKLWRKADHDFYEKYRDLDLINKQRGVSDKVEMKLLSKSHNNFLKAQNKFKANAAKGAKMSPLLQKWFQLRMSKGALIGGGVVGAGVLANRIFNAD